MWPFTRKADASKGPESPTSGPPPIHFEWKEIPAIQRVIADHPLTVPTEPFADALATHQDPRTVAKPLGHQVSLEAPRGLALGIAQPLLRHDGPELVPRIRPSRPLPIQRTSAEQLAVSDANGTADEAGTAMGIRPASPPRQLPASSEPALQRAPLTHVGADNPPVPLPLRRDIVVAGSIPDSEPDVESPEQLPAYPRLTLGQARRLGLGAPLSRVPDTAIQRAVDRPASPFPSPSPSPVTTEESTFSPIFPLDFASPKPVVAPAPISRPQRIPTTLPLAQPHAVISDAAVDEARAIEPEPTSTAAQPAIAPLAGSQSVATTGDPRITTLEEPVKGEREGIDYRPRRPLPLAGSGSTPATEEAAVDVSPSVTAASPAGDVAAVGAEPMTEPALAASPATGEPVDFAPLLSERPLATIAVQRAPEGVLPSIGGRMSDSATRSSAGVRIYRGGEATIKSSALGARAFTQSDDIYLPSSHGPLSDPPARSLLAHELVHVGQQRRMAGGLPAEDSSDGMRMEAEAMSVERAVATGAELPLARSGNSLVHSSTSSVDAQGPATGTMTIQRAPESAVSGPAPSQAPATLSAAQPVGGESPGQTRNEEAHLNELAAKLYDKIRSRLRNELLVDRERAGFLTDLR